MTTEHFDRYLMDQGVGGPSLECGCGRTCFGDSDNFDPGELEGLLKLHEEKPDRYLYFAGDDGVSAYDVPGLGTVVLGCRCNDRLDRIESIIWDNRDKIAKYLRARCEDRIGREVAVVVELRKVE